MSAPFVDFRNVWLAYNEALLAQSHFAIEDISLQMNEGEFVAIVGPSGCGKSTFMKLTTGLKMPSRGSVTIGGEAVTGPFEDHRHGVPGALAAAMAHHRGQRAAAAGDR